MRANLLAKVCLRKLWIWEALKWSLSLIVEPFSERWSEFSGKLNNPSNPTSVGGKAAAVTKCFLNFKLKASGGMRVMLTSWMLELGRRVKVFVWNTQLHSQSALITQLNWIINHSNGIQLCSRRALLSYKGVNDTVAVLFLRMAQWHTFR